MTTIEKRIGRPLLHIPDESTWDYTPRLNPGHGHRSAKTTCVATGCRGDHFRKIGGR